MKKILFGIGACALAIVALFIAYRAGHKEGMRHAIEDSVHFIVDYEEHDDYDYDLYIDIDGNTYLTTLFVG
jgi:hypothetical protein